jgi:hypothetical protein
VGQAAVARLATEVEYLVEQAQLRGHHRQVDRACRQPRAHECLLDELVRAPTARHDVGKQAVFRGIHVHVVDRVAEAAEGQQRLAAEPPWHEERKRREGEVVDLWRHPTDQHHRILTPEAPHRARQQEAEERQRVPHVRRVRVASEYVGEERPEGGVPVASQRSSAGDGKASGVCNGCVEAPPESGHVWVRGRRLGWEEQAGPEGGEEADGGGADGGAGEHM